MADTQKTALFVCAHLPSADAPQAGHKIAFANLVDLSRTHATDVLIACKSSALPPSGPDRAALASHARKLLFVSHSPFGRLLTTLHGMARGLAPRLASRYGPSTLRLVESLLVAGRYDTVWLEFSQCFWLAEHIEGRASQLVLSVHDVVTQLVTTKSGLESITCLGWTFVTEKRLLTYGDRIRVLSKKDASLVETLFRRDPASIDVRGPALSPFVFKIRRNTELIERNSILFWGAMGRSENSEAALRFIRTTFSRLQKQVPTAKLYIVGSDPPPKLKALACDSIIVTGFVADPTPYFEQCAVGIAPLESGAGIKLKVLEMLQAKLPVVSTPIGAEGVGADPLLTVIAIDQFNDAITNAWKSN